MSARAASIVDYRKPSFGNFLANVQTNYWFGIPRKVTFPGLIMDINRYASMNVAKDNNPATAINYNKQMGMNYSAYEHLIPETLFTNPADPIRPQAVSAAKAMALATSQGQKIYTLNAANQANHATLLAQITIDPQAKAEIQNALVSGKEVTVHQAPITQSSWKGSGYIITDPATGAGAYKISGGANGGWLTLLTFASAAILSLAVGFLALYIAVWLFVLLAVLTTALFIAAVVEGFDRTTYADSINVIGALMFLPIFGLFGAAGVVAGVIVAIVLLLTLLYKTIAFINMGRRISYV